MPLARATMVITSALLFVVALSSQSQAQRDDRRWELLGEKTVGFLVDRDVIALDQDEGWYRERRYRRLKLSVDSNDVHLNRIRLVYFNNYAEDFRVDRTIRENEDYILRLDGERGFLRRIDLSYRSRPSFEGRARVKIYGEPAQYGNRDRDDVVAGKRRDRDDVVIEKERAPDDIVVEKDRAPDDVVVEKNRDRDDVIVEKDRGDVVADDQDGRRWVELGCRRVAFSGRDRDTIEVGKREGWFRAIRLSAEGNDVEVLRAEVIYGNGSPDELDVRRVLRDGDRSRPYDLRGRERTIERIELVYRQRDDRGRTRVCAEGLLAG